MQTTDAPAFSYQPPAGGNLSLKSADGAIFLVHSVLLGMASSVFADMFSAANRSDVVELTDDAESLSLMLRFIYPPTFMDDLPLVLIEKSLRIAQKYDISGIITSIDHLMSHPSKKSSPLWHNPVQALCFAATYGLCETQKAAIEAVQPGRFTFDRPDQIKLLAENFPNPANVIGLLGAHCTRAHSLRELVFQTSLNDPSTGHAYLTMSCQSCYKEWGFPSPNKIPNFRPTWWPAWSVMAFCCLATEPFDKARRVFQISTLRELTEDLSVCRPCIDATCGVGGKDTFLAWTAQLETRVRERLGEIEALYEL